MRAEFLVRQADILSEEQLEQSISVVGAGAIGSQVVMCLAKMGFEDISVFDFDTVSEENISNQWFGVADIGERKVVALANLVDDMTGVDIRGYNEEVKEEHTLNGADIVIAAVDSMKVRNILWNIVKNSLEVKYFIDPRMSAEEGAVYCVDLSDEKSKERYEKTLYTDDEAVSERCTAKATMYCSMLLSGQVCKTVKDLVVKDKYAHTVHWNVKANAVNFYA